MHDNAGGHMHVNDLLEPLQEDMLTFNDAEPDWEWYPTSDGHVEGLQECLLFGGRLSIPSPTPMRITRKVSGPPACPSGGTKLELAWDEKDEWLEDDTANKIMFSFDDAPMRLEDDLPVRQPWRNSDKTEHRNWDRSPIVPSFCPLNKSKVTVTGVLKKPTRVSLRSSAVKIH